MFSIYSSAFNLIKEGFNYLEAIENFCGFAEEVVIAVNSSSDATLQKLRELPFPNLKVIETSFSYDDLRFDGKIKNAALQACSQPFCIQLDLDERVRIRDKDKWTRFAKILKNSPCQGLLIPVVDLFHTDSQAKSIGSKWYLHKREGVFRGVVKFAELDNGKINIDSSDSCEALDVNGNLISSSFLVPPNLPPDKTAEYIVANKLPLVYHLGWLNKEQRLRQNAFWHPVWELRAGRKVSNVIRDESEFDQISYFEHNFPSWKD